MPKTVLLLGMLFCATFLCAAVISVSGDGSMDYSSIQAAIASSVNGDIVLVYPGRYIENLDTLGKNITLASLELTTGDPSYKHRTIIDGDQNGTVIRIGNDESNVTIRGFQHR